MNLVEQLAKASAGSPPKRVLGIDLGTTNSTVAQVQLPLDPAGSPELLCECISVEQMTHSGPFFGSLVPSVVALHKASASTKRGELQPEATHKGFLSVRREGPRDVRRQIGRYVPRTAVGN